MQCDHSMESYSTVLSCSGTECEREIECDRVHMTNPMVHDGKHNKPKLHNKVLHLHGS